MGSRKWNIYFHFFVLLPRLSAALSFATRQKALECINARFPLCARYSVKLIYFFYFIDSVFSKVKLSNQFPLEFETVCWVAVQNTACIYQSGEIKIIILCARWSNPQHHNGFTTLANYRNHTKNILLLFPFSLKPVNWFVSFTSRQDKR